MGTQVLVVGAGPTGLLLGLWLSRLGITVRIIEKALAPGATSRAMVVHARTLEFYDQLGIADRAIEAGEKGLAVNAHLDGRLIARIPFGDFGEGLSPYPFTLVLPQDVHEHVLHDELRRVGANVEQGTELIALEDQDDAVRATLRTPKGDESLLASFVCGCDGAHSAVRQALGVGFGGGTYKQIFYVLDAEVAGELADQEIHFAFSDYDIFGVFPLKHRRGWRMIGVVPREIQKDIGDITYDDVAEQIRRLGRMTVSRVNWFSTYHVHHRVADSFRKGRAFLLGDAGHIHSPAGGQGMNTGIGDAANLAWKLAATLQRRAGPQLLESYPVERKAVAHRIVASTDRIFSFQVSPSWAMRNARRWLTPLMPRLMRWRGVQHLVFRTISQLAFEYRQSPISAGGAGGLYGGDRLPWIQSGHGSGNFASLRSLDWQVHVYGAASDLLQRFCAETRLPLHTFAWSAPASTAKFERDAIYLVRPDGYIGLAAQRDDLRALQDYISGLQIQPLAMPA